MVHKNIITLYKWNEYYAHLKVKHNENEFSPTCKSPELICEDIKKQILDES